MNEGNENDFPRDNIRRKQVIRELDYITAGQARRIAEETYKEKNNEFFAKLGYEISDFKEIRLLREDLDFLRNSREANVERKTTFSRSLITSVIGALMGVITSIFIWLFTHLPSK